jgi:hypothetical protein
MIAGVLEQLYHRLTNPHILRSLLFLAVTHLRTAAAENGIELSPRLRLTLLEEAILCLDLMFGCVPSGPQVQDT